MSEPQNDDPYRGPDVSQNPGELRTPGPLAIAGIVIASLVTGFAGFFGTCFGVGLLGNAVLSARGVDSTGAVIMFAAVMGLVTGIGLMLFVSRTLYRLASC